MDLNKLDEKFSSKDIEWRIGRCGIKNNKPWATALAYVQNRAIQKRLDSVCGKENWENEFREWHKDSQLCGISIWVNDKKITKWDGADNTDFEATKGGISDSMKRAACQWGVGRYLYEIEEAFVECSTVRQDGYKYAKCKEGVFYWKVPEIDKIINKNSSTTTTITKVEKQDKNYIYDEKGRKRYNKKTNILNDKLQISEGLIVTADLENLKEMIIANLSGGEEKFTTWLNDVYEVKFYDIKNTDFKEILETITKRPETILNDLPF